MIIYDKGQPGVSEPGFKDVDLDEATRGILSGTYLPDNRKIAMKGPFGGDILEADPRNVGRWLQDGYQLASDEEVVQYKAQDEGWLALGLGVGDALSLGVLNVGTEALERGGYIARGTTDEYRAARQENPWAYAAGSVAGSLTPMGAGALTARGAIGAGKVVKALGTGPAAIEKAARGLQRFTVNRFGGGTATSAARALDGAGRSGMAAKAASIATGAVQLGTESAIYGGIDGLSEADFGDPNVAGSQILASVGMHAVYGFGFGLAGGAAIKGMAASVKSFPGLWERATGAPAKFTERLRIKKFNANAPNEELLGKIDTPEGRAEILAPDSVRKQSEEISSAMDASQAAMDDLLADGFAGVQLKDAAAKLPKVNRFQQAKTFEATKNFSSQIWAAGDKMGGDAGAQLQAISDTIYKEATDYPKALQALVGARRALATMPKLSKRDKAVVRGITDTVDGMVTDRKLWGDDVAQTMREHLTFMERAGQVSRATRETFATAGADGVHVTNREQMTTFLEQFTDPKLDVTGLAIDDHISSLREVAKHLKMKMKFGGDTAKRVRELARTTARLEKAYGKASEVMASRNQVTAMEKAMSGAGMQRMFSEQALSGFIGSRGVATGIGLGVVINPVGAATAMAGRWAVGKVWKGLNEVYDPAGWFVRKAEFETKIQATATHIKVAAKETVKRSKIRRRLPPIARRMRSPALVNLLDAPDSEERLQAHQESLVELRGILSSPTTVGDTVAESLGQAADEMPNISNAIAMKILTNAKWMLDNSILPQRSPTMFGEELGLSDFELQKFSQQLAISQDPLHAVDLLALGELTLADVQAMRGMWPELYEQWRTAVMEELEALPDINDVPYDTRIQLSIMFDTPVDPTMSFNQILIAQEANGAMMMQGQGGQAQGPTNGPALMSDGLQSKSQESIMQGATDMDQTANRRTA